MTEPIARTFISDMKPDFYRSESQIRDNTLTFDIPHKEESLEGEIMNTVVNKI
jgi:hypothetical protein